MSDEVIRTLGLAKTYTDFWGRAKVPALKGLDLSVQRGEVVDCSGQMALARPRLLSVCWV